jgi:hypothetical protein
MRAPLTSTYIAPARRPGRASFRYLLAAALVAAAPLPAQSVRPEHAGHPGRSGYPPLHVDPSLEECSVQFAPTLTQGAFRRFAREFGSVSAFRQTASPATLGKGRLLIAVEMHSFTVDDRSDAWNDTFAHPNDHHPLGARQEFPKLKLRVGVTEDLDVGAFYTRNPHANYGWMGIDGKYAVVREREERPVALAVRGAYTRTLYVSDMDMHAATADVSVSRRLPYGLRPYAGLGADAVFVRETSDAVELRSETAVVPHLFGGVEVTVAGRLNLGAEVTAGARPSVQLQVGGVVF